MRRDLDELIGAFADGTLDPERITEVVELVRTDAEAAALLAAHEEVLHVIATTAPPLWTADESLRLRRSVAGALGVEAPVPSLARSRRRVPWPALATAAAALIGVLAITPLVGMLTTGGAGFEFDRTSLRSTDEVDVRQTEGTDDADPVLSFGGERRAEDDSRPAADSATPGGTIVVAPPSAEDSEDTTTTVASAASGPDAVWRTFAEGFDEMADLPDEATAVEESTSCFPEAAEYFEDGDHAQTYVIELGGADDRRVLVFFLFEEDGPRRLVAILEAGECEPVDAEG